MKRKTSAQLEAIADKAMTALGYLEAQGYDKEVGAIREFLVAQGEYFVAERKVSRDVAAELGRQIKDLQTTAKA